MTDDFELLDALREVEDPETGLNIVDLGLVYEVAWDEPSGDASVWMTLTSPFCSAGDVLQDGVERRLRRLPGVREVEVHVVFEPLWTPERVSDHGRQLLGW